MMADRLRTLGDPVLDTPTRKVTVFDNKRSSALNGLVGRMIRVMHTYNGVGLAANQIGVNKSVFVFRDPKKGTHGQIVNPSIEILDAEEIKEGEGCLSIPGHEFLTPRATKVQVTGQNIFGDETDLVAEGYLARVFQHETDHLKGKLYIHLLSEALQEELLSQV